MVANLVRLLAVEGVVDIAMLVAVKGRAVRILWRLLVVEVRAAMEVVVEVVVIR